MTKTVSIAAATACLVVFALPVLVSAQSITPETKRPETIPAIPLIPGGLGVTELERLAQQIQLQLVKLVMHAQSIQLSRMSASAAGAFEPAAGAGMPDPAKVQGSVKGASTVNCPTFSRTLRFGLRGGDVQEVQSFLYDRGFLTHEDVTGYYGYLTEAAVQAFQLKEGILSGGDPETNGYGVAGTATQKAMLATCTGAHN